MGDDEERRLYSEGERYRASRNRWRLLFVSWFVGQLLAALYFAWRHRA